MDCLFVCVRVHACLRVSESAWCVCDHLNLPVVNVALVVAHSDSDIAHFVEVKMKVVLVVVRGHPAHPHTTGLLPREDPYRVVVLRDDGRREGHTVKYSN